MRAFEEAVETINSVAAPHVPLPASPRAAPLATSAFQSLAPPGGAPLATSPLPSLRPRAATEVLDGSVPDPLLSSRARGWNGLTLELHNFNDLDAVVRVLIESTDGERTWTTIGVSTNIIEASWQALVDALVWGLLHVEH